MKRDFDNNKGFTLIELLVVLMILGILASIAVPSFTGYIDKQKEKDAIAECRQVVAAAQNMYNDQISKNNPDGIKQTLNYKEVAELAGVNGTVTKIKHITDSFYDSARKPNDETNLPSDYYYRIDKLTYTAENGLHVIYESTENPQYHPSNESIYTPLEEYIRDYQQTLKKIYENNPSTPTSGQRYDFALKYLEQTGDTFLSVDSAFLGEHNQGKDLYWQPYYIDNGTNGAKGSTSTLLFATPKDGSVTSGVHNGWNAYLVYFDGQLYESTKKDNKSGDYFSGIAALWNKKTDDQVKAWLDDSANNFKQIDY